MSTPSLKGKTIFITGASRGIGRAIALRAAKDGANVVIAAKSDVPQKKLEGTIHTVAEEVVKAGGQALACKVDLRNPKDVEAAVAAAVQKFGGIDIVVNNASALAPIPTLATEIKTYDLVNQINARGTWLTCRLTLPHLLKSSNPHILNLSPPLDMDARWFQGHTAYTMAKYGMSMVALGLAAEFKEQGVGVNCLWPLTTISTAALNLLGGDSVRDMSRTDEIMADAAHAILTKPSRECTGNFFIDEDLLRMEGVTDFSKYSAKPGTTAFIPDFFVPTERANFLSPSYRAKYAKLAPTKTGLLQMSLTTAAEPLEPIGQLLQDHMLAPSRFICSQPLLVQYDIKESPRSPALVYTVDISQTRAKVNKGKPELKADCVIGTSADDLSAILQGRLDARDAFASGRLIVRGSLETAMSLHGCTHCKL